MTNKRQKKKAAKKRNGLYDEEPTGLAGMAFKVAKDVKPGEKPITQLYGGSSGLADYADKLKKTKDTEGY